MASALANGLATEGELPCLRTGRSGTGQQPPQPPRQSWPRRHWVLTTLGAIVGLLLIAGVAGALTSTSSSSTSGSSLAAPSAPPASSGPPAATTAPAPVPSPDGKYSGSCDYTLSDSFNGNDHLVGEIDAKNTGNIGVVLRTRITWPQEGTPPIVAHRTVKVAWGQKKVVRFSVPVSNSGNVIDLLQSWQEHHNFRDGCTYHAAIIRTFGEAH
jgi:hypothetical protein